MKYSKLSRRMFLQGTGNTLLAIPFLESLLPSVARAADPQPTKRFIAALGNYDIGGLQNIFPTMSRVGTPLAIANHHTVYHSRMRSFMNDGRSSFSRIIVPELTPYLDQMNLYRGLDFTHRLAHCAGPLLGNFYDHVERATPHNNGMVHIPTIDQVLAMSDKFDPRHKAPLVLGGGSYSWGKDAGGTVVAMPRTVDGNLSQLYNTLFSNGTLPEGTTTPGTVAHKRADLLSRVLEDYKRVRNGTQISSVDKLVLDNAFDKLADVQRGISGQAQQVAASCRHKHLDRADEGYNYLFSSNVTLRNYANLIVAAMMCDLSRSAIFGASISDNYDTNPDPNVGFHHGNSHEPFVSYNGVPNWQYMGDIWGSFMRNFMAPLLQGLDGAIDPVNNRSVLYNSLVLFNTESSTVHCSQSMPALLMGSAGGTLRTGNYIDCSNRNIAPLALSDKWSNDPAHPEFNHMYPGVHYNRLLVTILQSMGLTPAEYETNNLNSNWVNRADGLYGAGNNGISSVGGYGYVGPAHPELSSWPGKDWYHKMFASLNIHHFKNPLPMP